MRRATATHLSTSALESLSEFVVQSGFTAGQRLPSERLIAEQLGISRPILREALKHWSALGIIETKNGSGSYLRRPVIPGDKHVVLTVHAERTRLLHTLEIRRALEVEAAGLAARRRTEQSLAHLQACFDALQRAHIEKGDGPEEDWTFHLAVYRAAENPTLEGLVASLQSLFHRFFEFPLGISAFASRSWSLHRDLFEAIRDRDEAAARAATGAILDIVQEDLGG
jgi:GntR family transcriptional regulator, transcriptional repressor for pyruvate dehydrogenase complex